MDRPIERSKGIDSGRTMMELSLSRQTRAVRNDLRSVRRWWWRWRSKRLDELFLRRLSLRPLLQDTLLHPIVLLSLDRSGRDNARLPRAPDLFSAPLTLNAIRVVYIHRVSPSIAAAPHVDAFAEDGAGVVLGVDGHFVEKELVGGFVVLFFGVGAGVGWVGGGGEEGG